MTHGMLPLMPKQQSRSASIAKAKKDSLDRTRSEQNVVTVLLGSADGLIFRNKTNEKFTKAVISALALVTIFIGFSSALDTADILCVIICMALGTIIDELIRIENGIEDVGDFIKKKLLKGKNGESFHRGLRYRVYRFLRWFDDDHGII